MALSIGQQQTLTRSFAYLDPKTFPADVQKTLNTQNKTKLDAGELIDAFETRAADGPAQAQAANLALASAASDASVHTSQEVIGICAIGAGGAAATVGVLAAAGVIAGAALPWIIGVLAAVALAAAVVWVVRHLTTEPNADASFTNAVISFVRSLAPGQVQSAPTTPAPNRVVVLPPPFVLPGQTTALQDRIDAARARFDIAFTVYSDANTPMKNPDGSVMSIHVCPGFDMVKGLNQLDSKSARDAIKAKLTAAGLWPTDAATARSYTSQISQISIGRGTPEEQQLIGQLLLRADPVKHEVDVHGRTQDAMLGFLFPKESSGFRLAIRDRLWSYKLGNDCVGTVSQIQAQIFGAKAQADGKLTGVFKNGDAFMPYNDSNYDKIFQVPIKNGKPVANDVDSAMFSSIAAGDVIMLDDPTGDPIGHCLNVYQNDMLRPDELAYYANPANLDGTNFFAGGPIRKLVVDSSWGAGGQFANDFSGVGRHIFFYNESTKQWAQFDPTMDGFGGRTKPRIILSSTAAPYDHNWHGVYRFKP